MKRFGVWILVALAAACVWTLPAFAGKTALSEADLDLVTAAGEPKVVQAIATGASAAFATATLFSSHDSVLAINDSSQNSLRALTLNNVAGENLVATGINIHSTAGSGGAQTNSITQSWGSTKDTGTSGGSAGCSSGAFCKGIFVAAASKKLVIHADVIVDTVAVSTAGTAFATSSIFEQADYVLALAANAQTSLAALVVNNVVGQNLVATGVNIANGGSSAIGQAAGFQFDGGNAAAFTTQTNTINQFKGTPFSRPPTTN